MNIHKNPITWYGAAVILFGIGTVFVNTHCTITPSDLWQLGAAVAAGIGGYLHGKNV